jgi:hypothetical protein
MIRTRRVVLTALILFTPAIVLAKPCGDDVDGKDVPCDCGDVVVSDLALGDDPVVAAICPSDGLIVRAGAVTRGITIDLRGHQLRGSGHGAGLWLTYGGPGGTSVISTGPPATITGFRDGINAQGADTLALVDNVRVHASRRDGVRAFTSRYEIRNVEVYDAGRDGFWLRGEGFRLSGTESVGSGRFGYFVNGRNTQLGAPGGAVAADGSRKAGFRLSGPRPQAVDAVDDGRPVSVDDRGGRP